jgi:hypothetical protein
MGERARRNCCGDGGEDAAARSLNTLPVRGCGDAGCGLRACGMRRRVKAAPNNTLTFGAKISN